MIINKTNKRELCKEYKLVRGIFGKATGLMFRRQIKDKGYIFAFNKARRIDLHMLFVFFPIDVIFLDEAKKVVEKKQGLMPFSLYFSKNKAAYVIEMSEGTIKKTKTEIGHTIIWR